MSKFNEIVQALFVIWVVPFIGATLMATWNIFAPLSPNLTVAAIGLCWLWLIGFAAWFSVILFKAVALPDEPVIQTVWVKVPTEVKRKRTPPNQTGYVYLLKGPKGYYKIGKAHNPADRRRTFDVKLPFEVKFEHLIQTRNMAALEAELHCRFAAKRINGEWFRLTEQDIAAVKQVRDERNDAESGESGGEQE